MDERGKSGEARFEFESGDALDLTSLSESEIRELLSDFSREEAEVSYRRRVLQGRIDLLRSELVRRGDVSVASGELAQAIMGIRDHPGHGLGQG
ncbi:hypothetical protein BH24ACT16_BH24ACT16_00700 [soil metagenome]